MHWKTLFTALPWLSSAMNIIKAGLRDSSVFIYKRDHTMLTEPVSTRLLSLYLEVKHRFKSVALNIGSDAFYQRWLFSQSWRWKQLLQLRWSRLKLIGKKKNKNHVIIHFLLCLLRKDYSLKRKTFCIEDVLLDV